MSSIKTYESYVRKANFFEFIGAKRKAINVMKEAVNQPFSKLDLGSGYIYIGLMYKELKELSLATQYFETALDLCKTEQYPFSPIYKKILECFIKNDESAKALHWHTHLLERASYDKKFLKLKKMNIA